MQSVARYADVCKSCKLTVVSLRSTSMERGCFLRSWSVYPIHERPLFPTLFAARISFFENLNTFGMNPASAVVRFVEKQADKSCLATAMPPTDESGGQPAVKRAGWPSSLQAAPWVGRNSFCSSKRAPFLKEMRFGRYRSGWQHFLFRCWGPARTLMPVVLHSACTNNRMYLKGTTM